MREDDATARMKAYVSVALCTYNGERYIAEQIRSILGQSLPVGEIVLSDDASADGTVRVVRDEIARFNRENPSATVELVVLSNGARLGVTKNFQRALESCRYDLIALCDQDDVWHHTKIAEQVQQFDRRPDLLLIHSNARLVDEDGSLLPGSLLESLEVTNAVMAAIHAGQAFDVLLRRNIATGATMMVRRALLTAALPLPNAWIHDEWLAIIAAAIGVVDASTTSCIDYRQHSANQIGVRTPTLRYKLARLFESRGDRTLQLAKRAAILRDRLQSLGACVPPKRVQAARGKYIFELRRARLPASRVMRVVPVVALALSGGYSKYASQGLRDIARDLIQRPK
jgi:glycosyltransferase involved in cell wall biosynthesis